MSEKFDAEAKAQEIVQPYRAFINETPWLLSLLYDIDMMPEQTVTVQGAIRLAGLCEAVKHAHALGLSEGREREGWVLVPREPTQEMAEEGGTHCGTGMLGDPHEAAQVYRAMIAAAPEPEAG